MADRVPEKEKPKKPVKTGGDDSQGTDPLIGSEHPEGSSNRQPAMDEEMLARVVSLVTQSVLEAFNGGSQRNQGTGEGTAPTPRVYTPDYNQATQNFKRRMPSFELGSQPFEQFTLHGQS